MNLVCNNCGSSKPEGQFRRDQHNSTGRSAVCNICFARSWKVYYANNKEKMRENANNYYAKNKKKISDQRKNRRKGKKNPRKPISLTSYNTRAGWKASREKSWASRGIKDFSYAKYEQMLVDQDNKCLICSKLHTYDKKLHVDHCHKTGKVRGLLCNNCNNAIGKLGDDPDLVYKAYKYLRDNE